MGVALSRKSTTRVVQAPLEAHEDTPKGQSHQNNLGFQETKTLMLSVEGGTKTLEHDLTLGNGQKDTVAYSSRVSARSASDKQKAISVKSKKSSSFASLFKRSPEK